VEAASGWLRVPVNYWKQWIYYAWTSSRQRPPALLSGRSTHCYSPRVTYLLLTLALLASEPQTVPSAQAESEAAYQFTVARSLSEEGAVEEALGAWRDLLELVPDNPYARIEFARFLTQIGRFNEAVQQVERGRDLAPDNPDALRAAADVFLSARRVDDEYLEQAVESLEALADLRPADVQVHVDLGRVLLIELDGPHRAAEVFARAVALQPASRMLQSYLIEALLRARDRPEAEARLSGFLERDPEFLRGRLLLANQQSRRGDHRTAVETLRAVPPSQRQDRDLRWQLASELYRTGDLGEGVALLDGLLEEQPEAFKERALKGMLLSALGHSDEAIELFEALHDERPDNVEIARALVRALERTGRDQRAEDVLRRSVEYVESAGEKGAMRWQMDLLAHLMRAEAWKKLAMESRPAAEDPQSPLHVQAYLMHIEALHRTGRSRQALDLLAAADRERIPVHRIRSKEVEILADLDRSEESERHLDELAQAADPASLLAAAEVYQRRDRHADAVPLLSRALELAVDSIHVRYWLGAAYERSGDRRRATETFRSLLRLDPSYAPALNYLGYMWAEQGEHLDKAVEMVDRAVALEPDNGAYVDSLGWANFRLGNDGIAISLLERASRLLPDDAVIFEHLGDVYVHSGESERARESYRRALELDGENREQVRGKLERLPSGR